MHPKLQWTSHGGDLLDRDACVARNTDGSLLRHKQLLEQPSVTVVGRTAALPAVAVDMVGREGSSGSTTTTYSSPTLRFRS